MRFIEDLCPPALLYLIFLAINLGLDAANGMWVTFVAKALGGIAATFVLDIFCDIGLGPVSWFVVAAPFIITAIATAISMGLRLDEILTRETFLNGSKMELVPADSNEITHKQNVATH